MTNDTLNRASRLLDDIAELLDQLGESLRRERELIGKDAVALETNAADKSRLVNEIEQLNQELFLTAATRDIQSWVDARGDQRLRHQWNGCLEKMRACSHLNMLNATLIEQQQQKVIDLLTILSGNETGNTTYDAHGETHTMGLKRSLGKS